MRSSRPRIVLDALLVHERPTGVGRSILELTRALSATRWDLDFSLLVTTPHLFYWLEGCPDWAVHHCPGATGGTLRKALYTQRQIPRICRKLGAVILHSLQFVAPLSLPCPSVVTVHDLAWLRFPKTVEQPRKAYYSLMVPRTLQRATAVVTNSEATALDVRKYYPRCRNVSVTPFGTPSWVWEGTGNGTKVEVGERPFFLFVGTLEPRKNLVGILDAYTRLLGRKRKAEESPWPSLLLVGGKGWKDSNLREQMQPLLQSGDLMVLEYCDTNKLRELYSSAQALLFPSLHEGFGFPILEAMAFGLPVITSALGAMAEVAGPDALWVDPNHAEDLCHQMRKIAESGELRARLSLCGPKWARKWSWQHTAQQTVQVYTQVLDRGIS